VRQGISLLEMQTGTEGIITTIDGGRGITSRLDALGIRAGTRVTKTSAPYLRGPVTVRVGNAQVAIGFGMAGRVFVQIEESAPR